MKRAVGYIRISTEDQSNFSLDGQEVAIRNYCAREGIELVATYREDGQSAKNFDRDEWKKLEQFIKANHKTINYLIVMKFDRFSRNVAEALNKIDMLENKYKILIISVNEPIAMHPSSPFYFQFRTQMLLSGDVELRIIKDRTKFGLHQAAISGRFTSTAPFGYKNERDEKNKPILVKVPEKATMVAEAYEMYLAGAPLVEIARFIKCGKSTAQRMLSNPLYAGMVRIPAYHDEPERLGPALHEPIVDASTWWRAQAKLTGKNITRVVHNVDFPLRGVLNCHCGRALTGGMSSSRGKKFGYYKCVSHPTPNLSTKKLHDQFSKLLAALKLPDHFLKELEQVAMAEIKQAMQANEQTLAAKRKELDNIKADIEQAEEKYIRNQLTPEVYNKWITRWEAEKSRLQDEILQLHSTEESKWVKYRKQLAYLNDLNFLYNAGDVLQKQAFIRLMFNNKLYYKDGAFRTTFILPFYQLKAASLQENRLLIIEQPIQNLTRSRIGAPGGT